MQLSKNQCRNSRKRANFSKSLAKFAKQIFPHSANFGNTRAQCHQYTERFSSLATQPAAAREAGAVARAVAELEITRADIPLDAGLTGPVLKIAASGRVK